jgi:phosphopantetheine--protein transferase-like protein
VKIVSAPAESSTTWLDLAPGQVHIRYRLTEGMSATSLTVARALLSHEERSRSDRYIRLNHRRDYVAAHALLRSSLSRYCDVAPQAWTFESDLRGKPALTLHRGAFQFNLSHASGIVGCVIAKDAAVGIDVERTDIAFDCLPIASRYFSDRETAQLDRCAPRERAARFIELWTLKEAYVKATGQGLSADPGALEFELGDKRIRLRHAGARDRSSTGDARGWHFAVFTVAPCFRISVAVNCVHVPALTLIGEAS